MKKQNDQHNADNKKVATTVAANTRNGVMMTFKMCRLNDKEMLVKWLMEEGLLRKSRLCERCSKEMSLVMCEDRSDGWKWQCQKQSNGKRHRVEESIRKGSWFSNSRLALEEMLKFTYWWCMDLDQSQIIHELGLSSSTSVDWDSFCREICEVSLIENSVKIGGEGKVVQIDESKFGKMLRLKNTNNSITQRSFTCTW